jgi:hypothetical protein
LVAIYGLSFLDSTSFFIARGLGHGRQIDSWFFCLQIQLSWVMQWKWEEDQTWLLVLFMVKTTKPRMWVQCIAVRGLQTKICFHSGSVWMSLLKLREDKEFPTQAVQPHAWFQASAMV